MLLNAHDATVPFTLPPTPAESRWVAVLDTARPPREHLQKLLGGDQYLLEVALARRARPQREQRRAHGPLGPTESTR